MRFWFSTSYGNLLAAILLPFNVYTRGGWHLFGCNAELEWLGKTRSQRAGSFLEAVEREASRLDRSGGSLYDAFAAGCPLPQVRINLSDLANCLLLLRPPRESFG